MTDAKQFWRDHLNRNPSVLDAGTRIWEIVCGLIMVLTFTCTISTATAARDEIGIILWAALGCNTAWGIVDALMYLMSVLLEREQGLNTLKIVRKNNAAEADQLIKEYLPPILSKVVQENHLREIRSELIKLPEPPARASLTRHDVKNSLTVFLLVFLSTFPAAIPFLFNIDAHLAMRLSNGIVLLLLFTLGLFFGRNTGYPRYLPGLVLASIGAILVAITIAMGG